MGSRLTYRQNRFYRQSEGGSGTITARAERSVPAQAHVANGEVRLFSRTRDEITESFPELPDSLAGLTRDAVLDGEIVAWEFPRNSLQTQQVVDETFSEENEAKAFELGRARPFSVLQQRLGRKKVSEKMLNDVPVAFLAFDVLYSGGELLIDRPLSERARILDELLKEREKNNRGLMKGKAQGSLHFGPDELPGVVNVIRAPMFRASSPEELEQLFVAAQARGNEGLMIKDLSSPYTPGKRGKSWLKMKRELATLDVVVTAVGD